MLSYAIFTLTIGGIYALLALSLNLAWGATGLVNLGLAGFFGIGAYATALLTGAGGLPIWAGLAGAVAAGLLAGLVIAGATLRLRDDYLAIVTLGFGEIVRLVVLNERWLTRGADGLSGIKAPYKDWLGPADFNLAACGVVTTVALVAWALLRRLDRGPYGRALRSVREDQVLAAFAGKRVLALKFQAFALAAAIAALAGALYAHTQSYISPEHIQPLITIYVFLAVTGGGIGRPAGALVGAYVVVAFLEATRFLAALIPDLQPVQVAAVREGLVGLSLLLVLHLRPHGLLPERNPPAPKVPA